MKKIRVFLLIAVLSFSWDVLPLRAAEKQAGLITRWWQKLTGKRQAVKPKGIKVLPAKAKISGEEGTIITTVGPDKKRVKLNLETPELTEEEKKGLTEKEIEELADIKDSFIMQKEQAEIMESVRAAQEAQRLSSGSRGGAAAVGGPVARPPSLPLPSRPPSLPPRVPQIPQPPQILAVPRPPVIPSVPAKSGIEAAIAQEQARIRAQKEK